MRDGRLMQRFCTLTDLPDEPLPGLPLVEIAGNKRVLIERHLGVTEYTKERVLVKVKIGHVGVYGSEMKLSRMTKGQLIIRGEITGVEIIKE